MQNHVWPIFSPIVTYSSATSYVPQDKIPRYEIPPPPQPVIPDNTTNYADLAPLSYPQMDTSKLVYAPIVRRKDLQQKIDAAKAGGSSKKTANGKKIGARSISRPPGNIPLKNPEFPAIAVKTKQGKHPLLIYRSKINNDNCYSFHFKKINGRGDAKTFVCNGCKNKKKTLHIMASLDTTYFLKCPETLPHICKPTSWKDQFADRELFGTPDEEQTPEKKQLKRDKRKLEEDTHLGMAEEESEVM